MKKIWLTVLAIGVCPLLWFRPKLEVVSVLMITCGLLVVVVGRAVDRRVVYLVTVMLALLVVVNVLLSGEILGLNFSIDKERMIWNDRIINLQIENMQREGLMVPYRLRQIVFNRMIYIVNILSNTVNLFWINKLANVLLWSNVGVLAIGIWRLLKGWKNRFNITLLAVLLVGLLAAGINKSPDPFNSFYPLLPILGAIFFLNTDLINTRTYGVALLISLFLRL